MKALPNEKRQVALQKICKRYELIKKNESNRKRSENNQLMYEKATKATRRGDLDTTTLHLGTTQTYDNSATLEHTHLNVNSACSLEGKQDSQSSHL